jgi:hypothetical protein
MKSRPLTSLLFLLCLTVTAFGCGGDDEKASLPELCASTCSKGKSKNCPAEANLTTASCEQTCSDINKLHPTCSAKYEAYLSCVNDVPTSSWICDEQQESNVPEGTCATEYAALESCIMAD